MSDLTLQFPLLLVFTILALVAVLVIAWFAIRFLANLNKINAGATRPIKILHTMAVGSRERLVLINYQGRDILLGVTAGGISVIEKTPPQHKPESSNIK